MEDIRRLIDEKYREFFNKDSSSSVSKEWFYDFANFLQKSKLSVRQITRAILAMMDRKNLQNMVTKAGENFFDDPVSLKEEKAFFSYLDSILSRITVDYVLEGIRFAEKNVQINSNFIDSFIRYIVITNFQDLQVVSEIPDMKGKSSANVLCGLGNFRLASLVVERGQENLKLIALGTRRNLRSTMIGALLFRKLQADVAQHFPGRDLIATTVDENNKKGIKLYKAMGATILEHENGIDVTALFPGNKLKELSEIPVEPPELEKTNLKTADSPIRAIIEYMNLIVRKQKAYMDIGGVVPSNIRIPAQIELSPKNVEFLMEGKTRDFIKDGETEDEKILFWEETEESKKLELRVKRNAKGRCIITYIKSSSMDGKEEFVWDSKTKEGKEGILIVSRENDALEEIIAIEKD